MCSALQIPMTLNIDCWYQSDKPGRIFFSSEPPEPIHCTRLVLIIPRLLEEALTNLISKPVFHFLCISFSWKLTTQHFFFLQTWEWNVEYGGACVQYTLSTKWRPKALVSFHYGILFQGQSRHLSVSNLHQFPVSLSMSVSGFCCPARALSSTSSRSVYFRLSKQIISRTSQKPLELYNQPSTFEMRMLFPHFDVLIFKILKQS